MSDQCCCSSQPELPANRNQRLPDDGFVSEFLVPKMDCPSEENLIRMALDSIEPKVVLDFDTPNRKVKVFHDVHVADLEGMMESVGLGARLVNTIPVDSDTMLNVQSTSELQAKKEAVTLKALLAINACMFFIEIVAGWWAQSTGLIADSLDMFADAAVYGLALYAVGRSIQSKLRVAHLSGWIQMILAASVLIEVARRFFLGNDPVSSLMMVFGFLALIANVWCLTLIAQNRDSGAHMRATWIFSANDVIANVGVIVSGLLVAWTGSHYPDLVIGLIIGIVVLNGALRILKLKA